ncbi:MAG: hypothetical protein OEY86_06600 [Nitrospira sp.]|nr:hypothetical protein [Nitrospira sp.]
MSDSLIATRVQLSRQVAHWATATASLGKLEDLASPAAWDGLERYLRVSVRQHLTAVIEQLTRRVRLLQAAFEAASSISEFEGVRRQLLAFRTQYLRAETTLDFYADAINSRTNPTVAGLLRACDTLAQRSMAQVLDQLGRKTPVVLTYIDKGLGASILKAGLRLWDGTGESPAAAIKIVRHNLQRPTALIHETGHQVAHIVDWNGELARALEAALSEAPAGAAEVWASWASEIAADAFAFVHTGYASVAALHDVLAGDPRMVLRYVPGDPHPISYVRVLLGVEMCRQFYGAGPWDDLGQVWTRAYSSVSAESSTAGLLRASKPLLPAIAEVALRKPMRAFGGRALCALVDPARVSPQALEGMERQLGEALYTSMHWIWTEAVRLLALTGFRAATSGLRVTDPLEQQQAWMLRLGGSMQAT